MSLVIGNSIGTRPGLHAFVVGVSEYIHLPTVETANPNLAFGLAKLSSPALSALKLCEWLVEPPIDVELHLPLKTLRVLLAPSLEERRINQSGFAKFATTLPTRTNFVEAAREWRRDASASSEDMTLFYFAGHGIKLGPEDVSMVMQDFADPALSEADCCARITNLRQGMAPAGAFQNIARTQFYFIDACRNLPEVVKNFAPLTVPDVFSVALNTVDNRSTPTYFATVDGGFAAGRRGKQTVFGEALLECLSRGAEQAEENAGTYFWPVTSLTLKRALDSYLNLKHRGAAPDVNVLGMTGEPRITKIKKPPRVDVLVDIVPNKNNYTVVFLDENGAPASPPLPYVSPLPYVLNTGIYRVECLDGSVQGAPFRSKMRLVNMAMRLPWSVAI